jgi:hypothetical protein
MAAVCGYIFVFHRISAEPSEAAGEDSAYDGAVGENPDNEVEGQEPQNPRDTIMAGEVDESEEFGELFSVARRVVEFMEGQNPEYFISRNGYLYNQVRGSYVSVEDRFLALYVRASDLQESYPDKLTVYICEETPRGYICVNTDDFSHVILTRERLGPIIGGYQWQKADAEEKGDWDYSQFAREGVDVRYTASDGKYSVVIYSEDWVFFELILSIIDADGIAYIHKIGGERDLAIRADINRTLPDFDMGLLPIYSLHDAGRTLAESRESVGQFVAEMGHEGTGYYCGISTPQSVTNIAVVRNPNGSYELYMYNYAEPWQTQFGERYNIIYHETLTRLEAERFIGVGQSFILPR